MGPERPVPPVEARLLLSGVMLAGLVMMRRVRIRADAKGPLARAAADLAGELTQLGIPATIPALCDVRYAAALRHLSEHGVSDWQTAAMLAACGDLQDDPALVAEIEERFYTDCAKPEVFWQAMELVLPSTSNA